MDNKNINISNSWSFLEFDPSNKLSEEDQVYNQIVFDMFEYKYEGYEDKDPLHPALFIKFWKDEQNESANNFRYEILNNILFLHQNINNNILDRLIITSRLIDYGIDYKIISLKENIKFLKFIQNRLLSIIIQN